MKTILVTFDKDRNLILQEGISCISVPLYRLESHNLIIYNSTVMSRDKATKIVLEELADFYSKDVSLLTDRLKAIKEALNI